MVLGLENPSNKDKIAIVAVGYNRKKAIERLLDSLNNAEYPISDVPLVISIDASEDRDLYSYVNAFGWNHGVKYVNIQEKRLGLKNHIFQCFSLTQYFKGVIVLEDDLFVSPYFYHYAEKALDKYNNEDKVAGIALYSNETNGFKGIPFQPVFTGSDVYAMQTVCSWGELLNFRMWDSFSTWLKDWDGDINSIDINSTIKSWTRAWSKFMYAYMVQTDRYFIYPYMPVSTNFNDSGGEHGGGDCSLVQVSLLQGKKNYQMNDFNQLACYDVYCHNIKIPEWLGIKRNELTIDYYGQRDVYSNRYVLTPFKLPYKIIKGFRHSMRPWELNIKYNLEGDDIILYDRKTIDPSSIVEKKIYPYSFLLYYFQRYKVNLSFNFLLKDYWHRFLNKIRKR